MIERGLQAGTFKDMAKMDVLRAVKEAIPSLSVNQFDKAWAKKAPESAKRGGPKRRKGKM